MTSQDKFSITKNPHLDVIPPMDTGTLWQIPCTLVVWEFTAPTVQSTSRSTGISNSSKVSLDIRHNSAPESINISNWISVSPISLLHFGDAQAYNFFKESFHFAELIWASGLSLPSGGTLLIPNHCCVRSGHMDRSSLTVTSGTGASNVLLLSLSRLADSSRVAYSLSWRGLFGGMWQLSLCFLCCVVFFGSLEENPLLSASFSPYFLSH